MQGNDVSIFDVEFDFWNLDFNVHQVPFFKYLAFNATS